ncbi:uncharacterized protein LOC131944132 [Physella acuta]|uniref:uncharacterized protein LOC131944132 n=1 Tax=Physella acuta TaxID=109671 RepID=UPI0027DE55BB|nr:uncharacterized protein LOC131944132 [Physella acuta]
MATLSGDIHFPPCDRDKCGKYHADIVKALKKSGLNCVWEYPLNGFYYRHFNTALDNCKFTVIHKCQDLWEKIKACRENMERQDEKLITVTYTERDKMVDRYDGFFTKFHPFKINDKGIPNFIQNVVVAVQQISGNVGVVAQQEVVTEETMQETAVPQVQSYGDNTSLSSETQVKFEEENQTFVQYPNWLGESNNLQPLVRQSHLADVNNPNKIKEKLQSLRTKTLKYLDLSKEIDENQTLILIKLMPKLYEEQNLISLTNLAIYESEVVVDRAILFLEFLLLSSKNSNKNNLCNLFINMESIVFVRLQELRATKASPEMESVVAKVQKLSTLYIIIVCEWIYSCKDPKDLRLCEFHIYQTVTSRSMTSESIVDKHFSDFDEFMAGLKKKNTNNLYRHEVSSYQRGTKSNTEQAKELRKKCLTVQLLVVHERLKKVYLDCDLDSLAFLNEFAETVKETELRKENSSVFSFLLSGISLFLTMEQKKVDNLKDGVQLCKEATRIIYTISSAAGKPLGLEKMLLFQGNPNVRTNLNWSIYERNQLELLLDELKRLLSPLLLIDKNAKMEPITEGIIDWYRISGSFNQQKVVACIHKPREKEHKEKNRSNLSEQEDVYYNQMLKLQLLKHDNIIQIIAYRETCIPTFYIVEDYLETNLQIALKNKKLNRNPFKPNLLQKFLLDALSALQYCHDQGFIHRNLTAASLFLHGERRVKLCGFQLCIKLIDGIGKADDKTETTIPTRWTSPESLKSSVHSKASDVWMVGHLINEVMTHGTLPYTHINLESNDSIAKHIIENGDSITKEDSVTKETFELITKCLSYNPQDRPTVSDVISKLNSVKIASERIEFTPLGADYQPSAHHELGVPDGVGSSSYGEDDQLGDSSKGFEVSLSDTMVKINLPDKHIFREKLVQRFSPEVITKINNGDLESTGIRSKVKFLENRKQAHHIECITPSTVVGSLLEVTLKKSLGDDLKPYIDCLIQVSIMLEKLWQKSWILGDLCGSHFYVDVQDQRCQVYLISLSSLILLSNDRLPRGSNPYNRCPEERAAPEVIKSWDYSQASDVYSFGSLMWEILTAFDNLTGTRDPDGYLKKILKPLSDNVYNWLVSEKVEARHTKPKCCPEKMYDLIKTCLDVNLVKRPQSLSDKLQRIYAEEFEENFTEA